MHEPFYCQCEYDYLICVTILSNSLESPLNPQYIEDKKILAGKQDFKIILKKLLTEMHKPLAMAESSSSTNTTCLLARSFEHSYTYKDRAPDPPPEVTVLTDS